MAERGTGELPRSPTTCPSQLTMAGNDVNINHRTAQLLEHLDHRALARGNAPCEAHQEHLPRREEASKNVEPGAGESPE